LLDPPEAGKQDLLDFTGYFIFLYLKFPEEILNEQSATPKTKLT
jgi:hypothetical protein